MTGTVAYRASSSSFLRIVRPQHDRVDVAAQHPRRVRDRLAAAELGFAACSTTTSPPSWRIATSKLTRVRVLGFSKISASVRPARGRDDGTPRLLEAARHVQHLAERGGFEVAQIQEVTRFGAARPDPSRSVARRSAPLTLRRPGQRTGAPGVRRDGSSPPLLQYPHR